MSFDFGFQDSESVCPRCKKAGLRFRLSTKGPWVLERDKATCSECNCEAQLWLDDHGDGTATVIPTVPGVDYDKLRYSTLLGLHRVADARLSHGPREPDLEHQVRELKAAIGRRKWEIIGSINGQERSMGHWQSREQCEQFVKSNFVPEGDHEDSSGIVRRFRYKYVQHT